MFGYFSSVLVSNPSTNNAASS